MSIHLGIRLNRRRRREILTMAGLAMPAIALLLVRGLFGVQPAPAQAGQTVGAPTPAPAAVSLSAEQTKLANWLRQARKSNSTSSERSPMDQVAAPEVEPVKVVDPAPKPEPVPEPAPTEPKSRLRIGAILTSAEHGATLAVINGKIFAVGAEVEPGWRITAMDGIALSVELTGPEDRIYVLKRDPN